MSISVKKLRIFVATATTLQVSLAAAHCFVTQSAASMALNELENTLNAKLFDRIGKRLVLTEFGKELLPKATEILQRLDEFKTYNTAHQLSGNLSISASKTTGGYFLPPVVMKFFGNHSNINIQYHIDNSNTVIERVLNAEVDLGFIEAECTNDKLTVIPIQRDNLLVVAASTHPLAKKKQVQKKELLDYSWILREKGSGTRQLFEKKIKSIFKNLNIIIELNEPEAIKKMVQESRCLSCLSESVVQSELANGQLKALRIKDLELRREFSMLYLSSRYQTSLLQAFIHFIKNNL